jgi:hypothetical protein
MSCEIGCNGKTNQRIEWDLELFLEDETILCNRVKLEMEKRTNGEIHPKEAQITSLYRYFMLLADARCELSGVFNENHLRILLNHNPSTRWSDYSIIGMADELDEELSPYTQQPDSVESDLIQLLRGLTVIQRIALGDALETMWRNMRSCSTMGEIATIGGLVLKEEDE